MHPQTLFQYSKMKLYLFFQVFHLFILVAYSMYFAFSLPFDALIATSFGRFILIFYFFNIVFSLTLMYLLFFFTPGVWRALQVFFAFEILSSVIFIIFYLSASFLSTGFIARAVFYCVCSVITCILWYLYFSHRKLVFYPQLTILLNFSADPKSFTTRICPCCKRTIDLEEKTCPRCHKEIPPILPKGFHLPPLKTSFVAEEVMSCPGCGKTMSIENPRCCFCGNTAENI